MTSQQDALTAAALAFAKRWQRYLEKNPELVDSPAITSAMQRGELPPDDHVPSLPPKTFPFPIPDYKIFELSPLGHAYNLLLNEGWSKRQALYMAWKAHPKELRTKCGLPETQRELFTQTFRLKSDNTVRQWRQKWNGSDEDHPHMEDRIESLVKESPLGNYRAGVLYALAESAIKIGQNFQDRKLFLEMTGDYTSKSVVDMNLDLTNLSDEELDELDNAL